MDWGVLSKKMSKCQKHVKLSKNAKLWKRCQIVTQLDYGGGLQKSSWHNYSSQMLMLIWMSQMKATKIPQNIDRIYI